MMLVLHTTYHKRGLQQRGVLGDLLYASGCAISLTVVE